MKFLENKMRKNMNVKNTKPIFYALLIFMSSIFAIEAHGQTTIEFTSPGNGVVLRELTSITGTVSGLPKNGSVKIIITQVDNDYDWVEEGKSGRYSWRGGPSGKWSLTNLTKTTSWSAPLSILPSGSNLPDGKYLVTASAFDSSGRGAGSQFRRYFTIRR